MVNFHFQVIVGLFVILIISRWMCWRVQWTILCLIKFSTSCSFDLFLCVILLGLPGMHGVQILTDLLVVFLLVSRVFKSMFEVLWGDFLFDLFDIKQFTICFLGFRWYLNWNWFGQMEKRLAGSVSQLVCQSSDLAVCWLAGSLLLSCCSLEFTNCSWIGNFKSKTWELSKITKMLLKHEFNAKWAVLY